MEDTFIFALDNSFSILREEFGAFTFVKAKNRNLEKADQNSNLQKKSLLTFEVTFIFAFTMRTNLPKLLDLPIFC